MNDEWGRYEGTGRGWGCSVMCDPATACGDGAMITAAGGEDAQTSKVTQCLLAGCLCCRCVTCCCQEVGPRASAASQSTLHTHLCKMGAPQVPGVRVVRAAAVAAPAVCCGPVRPAAACALAPLPSAGASKRSRAPAAPGPPSRTPAAVKGGVGWPGGVCTASRRSNGRPVGKRV